MCNYPPYLDTPKLDPDNQVATLMFMIQNDLKYLKTLTGDDFQKCLEKIMEAL